MVWIWSKVLFYGTKYQTVVMKFILLALEEKSLIFSVLRKNSALSFLRFSQVGSDVTMGMCLNSLFLGLGRWVFVSFPSQWISLVREKQTRWGRYSPALGFSVFHVSYCPSSLSRKPHFSCSVVQFLLTSLHMCSLKEFISDHLNYG